jgi:hypothetical protein
VQVNNLDPKKFLHIPEVRKTELPQLWFVGGSDLTDPNIEQSQQYGNIISNNLGKAAVYLTANGASNDWCADQILRSDIRSSDIVLWNIMFETRFPFWHKQTNQVIHVQQNYKKFSKVKIDLTDHAIADWLTSEHCFYSAVTHAHQVLNFCNKIGAKLLPYVQYPVGISTETKEYFSNFPAFTVMPGEKFIDVTADGWHPGPAQHAQYAELLIQALVKQNWA